MIELEAVEFVLEAAYCVAVRLHLRVVTARLLHYLVDDELTVTARVEAFDAELDGDAEATEEGLILRHIVRSREMQADYVPHVYPSKYIVQHSPWICGGGS